MKNTVTTFIDVDVLLADAARVNGQAPGSGAVIKLVLEWELESVAAAEPTSSTRASQRGELAGTDDYEATDTQQGQAEPSAPRSRGSWHDTIAQFPNP